MSPRRLAGRFGYCETLELRILFKAVAWTNASGGAWNTASNWSSDPLLPAIGDDVTIGLAGTYTVTLAGTAASINSLSLGAGSGTQSLAVNADLTLAAASNIGTHGSVTQAANINGAGDLTVNAAYFWTSGITSGTGKTTVSASGAMTISSSGAHTLSRLFENSGGITLGSGSASTLSMNNGTVSNKIGGTFTITTNSNIASTGGTNAVNNAGTLNESSTGTSQLTVPLNNTGTVQVQSGTFDLSSGGTDSGGFSITGGALIQFSGGTHVLNAGANVTGAGNLSVTAGTFTGGSSINITGTTSFLGGTTVFSTLFKAGTFGASAGTVSFAAGATISGAVTASGNGVVSMPVNGTLVLRAQSVSTSGNGRVDVNDNSIIVDSTGAFQPAVAQTLHSVELMIASARAGGSWLGNGLTSSAARNRSPAITMIGAMLGSDYKSISGFNALFMGQAFSNSAILVRYTYYGDANFNGKVDGGDAARQDFSFNQERTIGNIGGWVNGDFDYNGKIDGGDYSLLDFAFNTQGNPINTGALPPRTGFGGTLPGDGSKLMR